MAAEESRVRFLDQSDEDIQQLLEEAVPPNTRKATNMWMKILARSAMETKRKKNVGIVLATCFASDLNDASSTRLWERRQEVSAEGAATSLYEQLFTAKFKSSKGRLTSSGAMFPRSRTGSWMQH